MKSLEALFYKYQIWKYSSKLPFLVMREYGVKEHYSIPEIDMTIKKWSFNSRYSHIGYSILATENDCKKIFENQSISYSNIRKDIAYLKFNGDASYTICDLLAESYYKVGLTDNINYKADLSYVECLDQCKKLNLFNIRR